MAITPAIITVAADVPNPTFSRPSDTANIAAEWAQGGGVAVDALYAGLPRIGHQRAQRYSISSSERFVTGGMVTPGKFCANVATQFYGVVLVRCSGLTGGNSAQLQIGWFTSAGTALGYTSLVFFADAADWTVISGLAVLSPGATAHHARLRIRMNWSAGAAIVVDIAFAGFGSYDGTNGIHTLARKFAVGTSVRLSEGAPRRLVGALNLPSVVDRDRFARPLLGQLVCSGVPTAMRDALDYVYAMNVGRSWEGAVANPGGGQYPFLLVGNGMPTLPAVGMFDFTNTEFPLDAAPVGWLPEIPDWSGSMGIRERL